MKYLVIILILLFTMPAFANNLSTPVGIFEMMDGTIVIITDTPELYVPPEPVDTSIKMPQFIKNIKNDPGTFILDWSVILQNSLNALDR